MKPEETSPVTRWFFFQLIEGGFAGLHATNVVDAETSCGFKGRWVHGNESEGFRVYRIPLQFRKTLSWKQFEAGRVDVSHRFALLLLCPGQITPTLAYLWWAWTEVQKSCKGNQGFVTLVDSSLVKIDTAHSPSKCSMNIFTLWHEHIWSLTLFIFVTCLKWK